MTTGFAASPSGLRPLRWLVVPLAVVLFLLVGLAISTEDRRSFGEDGEPEQGQDGGDEANPAAGSGDGTTDDADDAGTGAEGFGDGSSIEVGSQDGRVGIELGDDGESPIARPSGAEGQSPTPSVEIGDETQQGSAGLRLTEDGRLEPVDEGDIVPGDIVLEPAEDGVDLRRSNGSRFEVRPDGETPGRFTVTEVAVDGSATAVEVGPDGRVELGDGVVLRLPVEGDVAQFAPDEGGESPAEDSESDETSSPLWRWIVLAALTLVAIAGLVVFYLQREEEAEEPFGPNYVGPGGIPVERFDEFIAMLRADNDPARALRLAFHAAERGMGDIPARRSTETPFEWHDRVIEGRRHLAPPLRSLCDRFATARFAPDRPSTADRDAAVAELVELHRLANDGESAMPVGVRVP